MGRLVRLTVLTRFFRPFRAASMAAVVSALALASPPAAASEASALAARAALHTGNLADGAAALTAAIAADPADQEARLGLGMIEFVQAIEGLSQGLYHYGLVSPESMLLPVVRMPVPLNPRPEPITYDAFRGLLQTFVDDLATAYGTLGEVSGEALVPVDLGQVRYDVEGDGGIGADERLMTLIDVLRGANSDDSVPSLVVHFDQADAIWLQGYTQVLSGIMEFWLAHDWRETFNTTFHLFFPSGEFPFERALAVGQRGDLAGEGAPIADLINFIHMFRWPVAEPEKMIASLGHFRQVFALSRANWDAILAETDDDHEWVPSPRQTGVFQGMDVTEDQVAAWLSVLDQAEAVLDGRLLVPHWRFNLGINVERVFTEPTTFDLVMWITGPSALPYLENGPIMTGEDWNDMGDAFDGSFATYLFWFN